MLHQRLDLSSHLARLNRPATGSSFRSFAEAAILPAGTAPSLRTSVAAPASSTSKAASLPAASTAAPPAFTASPYRQDLGAAWNPKQYATDAATQNLIKVLGGGTAVQTSVSPGDAQQVPQQNCIDFGNGYVANAGLTQQIIDSYGLAQAQRMFADMAKQEQGSGLGAGTHPSLTGYDPALKVAATAANVSPFTGVSQTQWGSKQTQTA